MTEGTSFEWTPLPKPADHPGFRFKGFHPGSTTLPKGHQLEQGRRPFAVDTIFDRDVEVRLRDGLKLYTDVFRTASSAADNTLLPAIVGWSPYGKTLTGCTTYENMGPFNCGVPHEAVSGYQKFEALDPAEWCPRGYAIIAPDARGAGMSEGNLAVYGQQEAEDIYDLCDWIVAQPWSNGAIAMGGNSWLGSAQVNHAARCPHPALKCIAPWEGFIDLYRDVCVRGGRPWMPLFGQLLETGFAGNALQENVWRAAATMPLYNDAWEGKNVPVHKINIPLYETASYSTSLHTHGSFKTFREAASTDKWIRVTNLQEWSDLYIPENVDDLDRFFERYTKGVDNGWERTTPAVRLTMLGFGTVPDVVNRPETSYPPASTKTVKYHLDAAAKQATLNPVTTESEASYEGHHLTDSLDFVIAFDQYTELAGYPKIKLWMACKEHDDMDVSVQLRKANASGELLKHLNYPCPVPEKEVGDFNIAKCLGPQGVLRASHSISYDAAKSTETEPFYRHDARQAIPPGTIVPLEIGIWPIGMVFSPGERLVVRVSGHDMCLPETPDLTIRIPEDGNVGEHVVHTGGRYDSHILLPVTN